jgi:hypothetical protein
VSWFPSVTPSPLPVFPLLFRTCASATILLSHHSPISTVRTRLSLREKRAWRNGGVRTSLLSTIILLTRSRAKVAVAWFRSLWVPCSNEITISRSDLGYLGATSFSGFCCFVFYGGWFHLLLFLPVPTVCRSPCAAWA